MKKQRTSMDGFVPRRSNNNASGLRPIASSRSTINHSVKKSVKPAVIGSKPRNLEQRRIETYFGRPDIGDSLKSIDSVETPKKKISRRQRRRMAKQAKKPQSLARRVTKRFIILLIVIIVAVGGYLGYKFINAGGNILQGNILNVFNNQPLKQDSNGRSNFLILGTSEDDPGHEGAGLTDSILVVSIDQTNKNMYIFSVPRDLYVDYGMGCNAGYSGKINGYFMCANDGTSAADEQDRLAKIQKFVGDIFGLDIQYGIHVYHTVIKQAVDAVGGVDVDIQGSNGASGVLDRNFDWRCKYTCYLVKYENGVHHLDGEHALYLSMARGDVAPTYGLGNSNFDREKNQQKILIALKDKAMSTGTLTNLGKITGLLDALGSNLRTNIQTNEIRTLMDIASKTASKDIHTISLVGDDNAVVKSGNYYGASVVMPSAGMYDYSDIQALIGKNLSSNPVVREAAPIVVLNGTDTAGFGQTKANALKAAGYNVALVDNAPEGTYGEVEIYQIGTKSSETAKKLASTYNVTVKTSAPPIAVDADVQFVIIFGPAAS